jgi:glycosyltransferase involved in cell wall biosynthesis
MAARTVIVCECQVPLVSGGAEIHARELVHALRRHGYLADRVAIPFKWYPKEEILAHAAAWRLIDLSESNGQPIDLVIGTKFPSYFVRHPRKVTWLVHQYRAGYELCGTCYSDFDHSERDVALRDRLLQLDREMLSESRRIFTIARNISMRLEKFNGLSSEPLYPPPKLADRIRPGPYGDYVLSIGRIETVKRVDLAVKAMTLVDRPIRLLVAGDGTGRDNVERLATEIGVADRVEFLGRIDDERLIELYAGALAVVFAPYDEDYGYITLEAFLARKPIVTAQDSGGPLEFVRNGINGLVCAPDAEEIAGSINRLAADRPCARRLGEAGFELARTITWDGVIEKLVNG